MIIETLNAPVVVTGRPRYEGANIRTWVGFKHFMYLVEEGVLAWFRARGDGPSRLFHEHGLGLEIVDSSVSLPAVLDVDDEVAVEVTPKGQGRFGVRLTVERAGELRTICKARVAVALVQEATAEPARPLDGELAALMRPSVALAADSDIPLRRGPEANAFLWSWPARYFHCHYSDRVQHSAYVRALEEVVDRFLAERGLGVGPLLVERGWIPVVSRARVRLLADVHMGEMVHTTFVVEDVLKAMSYEGRMDCFVERDGRFVHVAMATILHGYAVSRGERAGSLAELDETTVAALLGGGRP
ncbi:MAG: thioesterase family protein [Actinobacteria bacterium]|nr:thioesterase family protein [Actinomycetota bacterium]